MKKFFHLSVAILLIVTLTMCTHASETITNSESQAEEAAVNLTIDNCEMLATILQLKNPGDPLIEQFASENHGKVIEFDGNIAYMNNHGSYKTRYDILIYYGDYNAESMTGPNFQFRDVNVSNLHLKGENIPEYVRAGQNYHIEAEIVKYEPSSELFILNPVSMELR